MLLASNSHNELIEMPEITMGAALAGEQSVVPTPCYLVGCGSRAQQNLLDQAQAEGKGWWNQTVRVRVAAGTAMASR